MKKTQRILLVDDDADDQVYFRDAVHEVNDLLECQVANNGREALLQIDVPPPPDFIFLDLNMPVMNGYEFLEQLKTADRYKHIPVIIFTTSKDAKDMDRVRQMGADFFLTKPTNFDTLCRKLDAILNMDFKNPSAV